MGIKSKIIRPYAKRIYRQTQEWSRQAVPAQEKMAKLLINRAAMTEYGRAHQFHTIVTSVNFREQVPVQSLSDIQPFMKRLMKGEKNVLWHGKTRYFTKDLIQKDDYYPISKESLPGFFTGYRNALFNYACEREAYRFFEGKVLVLSQLEVQNKGIYHEGNALGVASKFLPAWSRNHFTQDQTQSEIADPALRIGELLSSHLGQPVSVISGTLQELLLLMELLQDNTTYATLKQAFPMLELLLVKSMPEGHVLDRLLAGSGEGVGIMSVHTTPYAFLGWQDNLNQKAMLLCVNSGIYYEFIEEGSAESERIWLKQVEKGKKYRMILNSNAGLWGFDTGIQIEFVELNPFKYRIVL